MLRLVPSTIFSIRSFCSNKATDLVLVHEEHGVRNVVLNNSSKRNVLSLDMISKISASLHPDPRLRCVVISASEDRSRKKGGTVFSAGHDLQELRCEPRQGQVLKAAADLMIQLQNLPVPTVCKIEGPVVAAGVQLMASCDIVIASTCSTFSTPGINFGVSCMTPIVAVCRSANVKTSAYMLLTGRPISAEQAVSAGLITAHCPKEQLDSLVKEIVSSLVAKSRPLLAHGKDFFYHQLNMSLSEAYAEACQSMSRSIKHPDAQRGIDAFVNKQNPIWTHDPEK